MRIVYFPVVALALKAHFVDAQRTMQRKVVSVQYATGNAKYEGTGKFYVNDQTETCVRDCEPGSALEVPNRICGGIVQESWIQLFNTVSECCSFKLSWITPAVCEDKANPSSSGTFKFFADVQSGFCRRDCDPGYAIGCQRMPPPVVLHDTIDTCCSISLAWVEPKFCDTRSVDAFSDGWVVDWLGEKCVQDCDPSNGPPCANHQEPTEKIFNTPQECCKSFSWIDNKKCVGKSVGTSFFSNQWYVDWTTNTCRKDCDYSLGLPCNGNPSGGATLFYSAEACCQTSLSWVSQDYCVGISGGTPSSPNVPSPTVPYPTLYIPSQDPLSGLTCQTNSDCHHVCQGSSFSSPGMCQLAPPPTPTPSIDVFPTTPTISCTCTSPKTIPDKCELEILIDEMEFVFSGSPKLFAQSLRAAFHDAGTFDGIVNEGGANGCLLTDLSFQSQGENFGLDLPLNTLREIKDFWINRSDTCIDVSSADILQFAAFFSVVRQSNGPGLTQAKRDILTGDTPAPGGVIFGWGRPDEANCDTSWTDNLPGFQLGSNPLDIPARCTGASGEIKEKMMERNGFTAMEATALIGAHTIGLVRFTFGSGLAGPWVPNGDDNASANGGGPVFDNAYHNFLINTIVANNVNAFAADFAPFDKFTNPSPNNNVFGNWFRDTPNGLDHLDTDIALAFPATDLSVPDFHPFTLIFANDNDEFIKVFFLSLDKMSKLGVMTTLQPASVCSACSPSTGGRALSSKAGKRALQEVVDLETLTTTDMTYLIKMLGNATAYADKRLRQVQFGRREEIKNLTTPLFTLAPKIKRTPLFTLAPNSAPSKDPLSPP